MRKATWILCGLILICFTSCNPKYEFTVRVEYCNDKAADTVSFVSEMNPYISTYKEAVPVLAVRGEGIEVINVCKYEVLEKVKIEQ